MGHFICKKRSRRRDSLISTLSEHTGNGNPPATSLQPEDTKKQIDGILQHFDVLPSRFDRFLFKYISVYLIGLFFLNTFLYILTTFLLGNSSAFQITGDFIEAAGIGASIMAGFILVIWLFNVWRSSVPKTLRDLFEKKRIYVPNSNVNIPYLRFLENYHDALASPKRYALSGFLMIVWGIIDGYVIFQFYILFFSTNHPNIFVAMLVVVGNLLFPLSILGGIYCLGILTWSVYISGWYVRKLVRAFQLSIQPFHPDQCGGFKLLGNFCFGLASPMLIATGLTIGYILFSLLAYSPAIYGSAVYLALNVGVLLLFLLLYALPVAIFAFVLPMRDIHAKMVSEGETDENSYIARIEALREEIQSLLDTNQVEAAKAVQEKKALVETLYIPYPTWPFHVRSKLFSAVLGVSGSILIGAMTAALQRYILTLLFHTP